MLKVRNRSLFILLGVIACTTPLVTASQQSGGWLAQVSPDSPEPESPEAPPAAEPVPAPVDSEPGSEPNTSPDAVGASDGSEPLPTQPPPPPGEENPPELKPTFTLPETLPEGTSFSIAGSSSMDVITRSLQQAFVDAFPNASVDFTEESADIALQSLQAGDANLAAIGRPLTDAEKAEGLTAVSVSREKIAIIVGEDNPFSGDVDSEDFVRIFRGEVTNWNQLGGPDLPIRLIDRPETSDTRQALGSYDLFSGDLTTGGNVEQVSSDSTAEVVEALGESGIGYAIASQVLDQANVRVLSMHDTLPDDPRYPYSQPRDYVYQSDADLPTAVEAFLAFATNPEGQEAVDEAKAAEAADVAVADLSDSVIAMRPNDPGFVTGDRAGNLNFWNADGSAAGAPVSAHTGPVTALTFTSEGQRLISGGADGTIRFWDAVGTPIGEPINAGNEPVTSLVGQSDGSFISASASGTLQRWSDTGNPNGEPISGHEDTVREIELTPDGQTLITASEDGTIRRWNPTDGSPIGDPIASNQGAVYALAVKPDGSFVSGGTDGTVRQWNSDGTAVEGDPVQVSGPVTALAINPDGTDIAVGNETGSLQLLSGEGIAAGAPIDVETPIADLAYTSAGDRLVVSSAGDAPQIRDDSGQLLAVPSDSEEQEEGGLTNLPPELQNLRRRIQQLPPQMLWIIPIVLLGILLLAVLRSWRSDEDEGELDENLTELPPGEDADWTMASRGGVTTENLPEDASSAVQDPDLAKAKQALAEGESLAKAGRHQEALETFNRAIESTDLARFKAAAIGVGLVGIGALIARGLAKRGAALANLGRTDEAQKSFDRSLEMDSNDIHAWIGKGNLMIQTNRFDEAVFYFDKAIEINPNISDAWQGKGKALQQMGRNAEAQSCFAKAQELEGRDLGLDNETDAEVPSSPDRPTAPMPPVVESPDAIAPPAPEITPSPASELGIQPNPEPVSASPPREADVPPELQEAIENLPEEPDQPSPYAKPTPPMPVPQDVEAIITASDSEDAGVPEALRRAVDNLPAKPDLPAPDAPMEEPMEVPPEVEAILAEDSPIPSAEDVGTIRQTFDDQTARPAAPVAPMPPPPPPATPKPQSSGPKMSRPATALIPDQPDDSDVDPALEGLPSEVLEALRGIPENSADSFNLPAGSKTTGKKPAAPPPPPPSNPRLKKRSPQE